MIKIIKVRGSSMSPVYNHGDFVILLSRFFKRKIIPEKDVVFKHPFQGLMTKRIKSITKEDNTISVYGLSNDSISSRKLGQISILDIVGVVLKKN